MWWPSIVADRWYTLLIILHTQTLSLMIMSVHTSSKHEFSPVKKKKKNQGGIYCIIRRQSRSECFSRLLVLRRFPTLLNALFAFCWEALSKVVCQWLCSITTSSKNYTFIQVSETFIELQWRSQRFQNARWNWKPRCEPWHFFLFFGRIFVRLVDTIQNTMFKRRNFRVNLRKIIAAFPVRLCKSLNVGNFSESVEAGLFQNSVWWLQSGFAYLAHFQVTRDWRKKNQGYV